MLSEQAKASGSGLTELCLATSASLLVIVAIPQLVDLLPKQFGMFGFIVSLVAPIVMSLLVPRASLGLWSVTILLAAAIVALTTLSASNDCPVVGTSAEPCVFSALIPIVAALFREPLNNVAKHDTLGGVIRGGIDDRSVELCVT